MYVSSIQNPYVSTSHIDCFAEVRHGVLGPDEASKVDLGWEVGTY